MHYHVGFSIFLIPLTLHSLYNMTQSYPLVLRQGLGLGF